MKIKLENLDDMDPLGVYLEDFSPGRGLIMIETGGAAYCAYWESHGRERVADYFLACENDYLVNKLRPDRAGALKKEDSESLSKIIDNVKMALSLTQDEWL